ncbi:MAG: RNA-binding transcriptional accessory protein, partial [Flavobacteriales bacterium]|nr:RNA-binding transcriptional accessory protein [Flavobacteriales bacterium]
MEEIIKINDLAKKLNLTSKQVKNTLELLNNGATIPFISRYRKEATNNLDEVQIEAIAINYQKMLDFEKRKEFIIASITEQGKLSADIKLKIDSCTEIQELEDIYLPFKPRRETKADKAIALGLEPLAKILMSQTGFDFDSIAQKYVNSKVTDVETAISGAKDIASQWIAERQIIRQKMRTLFWNSGFISSKLVKGKEDEAEKYKDYFDFEESIKKIKSHRILALFRAQNDSLLKVNIEPDKKTALSIIEQNVIKPNSP